MDIDKSSVTDLPRKQSTKRALSYVRDEGNGKTPNEQLRNDYLVLGALA